MNSKIEIMEGLEEGLDAMCNLSQGVEDAAKKKAKKKTKKKQDLRYIKLLMKNMNLTVTEAMNLLEIPVNKQKKYEKLISS